MRKFSLLFAVTLSGCGTMPISAPTLPGYQYSFPILNRDLPPGTVVVEWKDKIDIVCTPHDYGVDKAGLTNNPPEIQATQLVNSSVGAQAEASVRRAIDTALGGANVTELRTEIMWKPLKLGSPPNTAKAVLASSTCGDNAKLYRESYGRRLKRFSLITDVASATFRHTATLGRTVTGQAGLADEISEEIGASVDVKFSGTNGTNLNIAGNELFIQYNSDGRLLNNLGR